MKIEEMSSALLNALTDDLEVQVLDTLLKRKVEEIQPKDLYYYYKELRKKNGVLNRRSRVTLLHHIVQSIHALKMVIGWAQLEKGHGKNGKSTIIRQAYEAKCEENECKVDFKSQKFRIFYKAFNEYHIACIRFGESYAHLGPILLLCQRLRIQRFADTYLGVKLTEAVNWVRMTNAEAARREVIHRGMLESVVEILEGTIGGKTESVLVAALKDIDQNIWTYVQDQ
ncbi:unnamed protein product [Rhizoctonia solani]|uniref:Uncharacterized protein n=1 Tax=Rhizoctonia solani TaxID=456999 RepID=A0A8H3AR87_9AGAM|nr:unnamed protein product [Rhizoctonia solani]